MDFTKLELPGAPFVDHSVWVYYDGPKMFSLRSVDEDLFYIVNAVDEDDVDGSWMSFLAAPQGRARFELLDWGRVDFRDGFTDTADGYAYLITWTWVDEAWSPAIKPLFASELTDDMLPMPGARLGRNKAV